MSARDAILAVMPHVRIIPIIDGAEGFYFGAGNAHLGVWATRDNERGGQANFTHGKCSFCHQQRAILEIANASDEYGFERACRECLSKIFDVFEQHEKGEGE